MKIARGDVWLVDLDPVKGHEQAKQRPCVVISTDTFNNGPGKLAVIAPLTSQYRPLSWLVQIDPPHGGVLKRAYIMCHQIRTVSLTRFSGKCLGAIAPHTLGDIEFRLRILLRL